MTEGREQTATNVSCGNVGRVGARVPRNGGDVVALREREGEGEKKKRRETEVNTLRLRKG